MILRGISFIPTHRSTDIAILAKRAEGLGFDSIWVPEQHTLPVKVEKPVPIYCAYSSMERLFGDPEKLTALLEAFRERRLEALDGTRS